MSSEVTALRCGHEFDAVCINIWQQINHTCPLCRESDVPINETHSVTALRNTEAREGSTATHETSSVSEGLLGSNRLATRVFGSVTRPIERSVTALRNTEAREGSTATNETNNSWEPTRSVRFIGNYAYFEEPPQGLRIVDVSDPSNPIDISVSEGSSGSNRLATRTFGSVTVRIQ